MLTVTFPLYALKVPGKDQLYTHITTAGEFLPLFTTLERAEAYIETDGALFAAVLPLNSPAQAKRVYESMYDDNFIGLRRPFAFDPIKPGALSLTISWDWFFPALG